MYAIGYDIGSSSVKASIVKIDSEHVVAIGKYPESEMHMEAKHPGWAEQDPEMWWESICILTKTLLSENNIDANQILSIGIGYQMHGLVLVDKNHQVIRPSIIWCDSRAAQMGDQAFIDLGSAYCLGHLLNSPGNFTASKLKWVKENEPELFEKVHKWMLPGDFIAMKFTNEINSTVSGYSEGMFWDFKQNSTADHLLNYYGIPEEMMPDLVDTFSIHGRVTDDAAQLSGLAAGTPVTYRAGDQPNNAMALKVLHPGDVAATGGTSGVVYAVTDKLDYDVQSRVNGFAHINHTADQNRIGQLLCINGCGILYAWMRKHVAAIGQTYENMEAQLKNIPVGSEGLIILPFGNGSERILNDKMMGARIDNLQFNRHTQAHLFRAALEGIVFSFVYGMEILQTIGITPSTIKVGNDNLFLSDTFTSSLSNLLQCNIEMYDTTGAVGAAKASTVAIGVYNSIDEAIEDMKPIKTTEYKSDNSQYQDAYHQWTHQLSNLIK
ncbi:MAG: FGGY family carbohydrate kinase [Saprospiraceae bacterium]